MKYEFPIRTAEKLRTAFWLAHPHLSREKIPNYAGTGTMFNTDTRAAWTDYKDGLCVEGWISQELKGTTFLS